MMSIESIMNMADEAAEEAEDEGLEPLVINKKYMDITEDDIRPIPFIGTYRPEGWELVDTLFIDMTGWGEAWEPALTIGQFIAKVQDDKYEERRGGHTIGYAFTEIGQFQGYVGRFKKLNLK